MGLGLGLELGLGLGLGLGVGLGVLTCVKRVCPKALASMAASGHAARACLGLG